jgi:hypothetical protein
MASEQSYCTRLVRFETTCPYCTVRLLVVSPPHAEGVVFTCCVCGAPYRIYPYETERRPPYGPAEAL